MKKDLSHLSELQYKVTQEAATEPPFSGVYDDFFEDGVYKCVVCREKLFESHAKFDSGCGWPAFFKSVSDKIILRNDDSHGMQRTEVICKKCGAHLGHLFDDVPQTLTGQRFCINSCSLDFESKD